MISDEPSNQKELAESYGITQQTMNNYMRMASMIPELEDLVDTGMVTPTAALAMMRNLSEKEIFSVNELKEFNIKLLNNSGMADIVDFKAWVDKKKANETGISY